MPGLPRPRRAAAPAALLGCVLTVGACGAEPELRPPPVTVAPEPTIAAYDEKAALPAAEAALSLVPADADVVTVTDFDESRAQLGVPDLTSDALMTDRSAYWEQAPRRTVLLAGGLLVDDASALWLDHGFTQDDVDWEARFTTPDGPGWVLGFRPDLDMARVADAVAAASQKGGVAALEGAVVDRERHLVSVGMAEPGEETWGSRPGISELLPDAPAESAYYRAGCVPLGDALGPDADFEDQDAVLAAHDVAHFGELETFSISFVDGKATARLGLDRTDVFARAALAESFPTVGPIGWSDGFDRQVSDPSTGRIGWDVTNTVAAANLVLTDVLPFAVCNEVTPMEEPTGL